MNGSYIYQVRSIYQRQNRRLLPRIYFIITAKPTTTTTIINTSNKTLLNPTDIFDKESNNADAGDVIA